MAPQGRRRQVPLFNGISASSTPSESGAWIHLSCQTNRLPHTEQQHRNIPLLHNNLRKSSQSSPFVLSGCGVNSKSFQTYIRPARHFQNRVYITLSRPMKAAATAVWECVACTLGEAVHIGASERFSLISSTPSLLTLLHLTRWRRRFLCSISSGGSNSTSLGIRIPETPDLPIPGLPTARNFEPERPRGKIKDRR